MLSDYNLDLDNLFVAFKEYFVVSGVDLKGILNLAVYRPSFKSLIF